MGPFEVLKNLKQTVSGVLGQFVPSKTYSAWWGPDKKPEVLSNQLTGISQSQPQTTATLPLQDQMTQNQFRFQMGKKDYSFVKPQLEKLFQAKGNPPLQKYVNNFIEAGEKYGVDPRVLVSIAGVESSFGTKYPTESFNPFGYLVKGADPYNRFNPAQYPPETREIAQGLFGAGFESLPHAIDALTGRFQRQPFEGYQRFYQDPTLLNLQKAYNATPSEQKNYIRLLNEFANYYQ